MSDPAGGKPRNIPGSVRPLAPNLTRVAWRESDRFIPRRIVRPLLSFMRTERAPAAAMTIAAVVAFVWANTPWHAAYFALWTTPVLLHVGTHVTIDLTLRSAVNDAGMALFFLLIGVELKTEIARGHLRKPRDALLPAVAAIGGMVVPALCYLAVNTSGAGERGWGVPMATDVAFALGIVALLGARISRPARAFLLGLAIVDDIGGILIIAAFYTKHFHALWLIGLAAAIVVAIALRQADVQSLVPYVVLGALAWLSLDEAGVEPAIVGVVFGMLAPLDPLHPPGDFRATVATLANRADRMLHSQPPRPEDAAFALVSLDNFVTQSTAPSRRLELRLSLWVNLAVLPLFALANAGVRLAGLALDRRVFLGVVLGLVAGKVAGIVSFTSAVRNPLRWHLPGSMTNRELVGVGTSAGIGFSVSLFIAFLAFDQQSLVASASLGVLAGSAISGLASIAFGALFLRRPRPVEPGSRERAATPA